jgi:Cdc6-like AAA superfamily ATPase
MILSFETLRSETKLWGLQYISDAVTFVEESNSKFSVMVVFNTFLDLYESCLIEYFKTSILIPVQERTEQFSASCTEDIFLFAMLWSFGALIRSDLRAKFELIITKKFEIYKSVCRLSQIVLFDYKDQLFNLDFDFSKCAWTLNHNHGQLMAIDTNRRNDLIMKLIAYQKNVMIVGPLGTGKTKTMQSISESYSLTTSSEGKRNSFVKFNCLQDNDVLKFTESLNRTLIPKGHKSPLYKPAEGDRLVSFVDDLQLATINTADCRPLWEFLHQLVENGIYWANTGQVCRIDNLNVMGVLDLASTIHLKLPERLLRHFSIIQIHERDVFKEMCAEYISQHRQVLVESPHAIDRTLDIVSKIGKSSMELIFNLQKHIPVTIEKPFNLFTAHDLENIYDRFNMADAPLISLNSLVTTWLNECRKVFRVSKK